MKKLIKNELERLYNLLKVNYPPSHKKHLDVFNAYWNLYEILISKRKGGDQNE